MNGVEILAVEEVAVAFGFDWSLFISMAVFFSMLFGIVGVFIAIELIDCKKRVTIFVVISILIGLVLGIMSGFKSEAGAPTKFETHYKVTISEEVPMVEFFERYEIIEQEGKIYTIREVD